MTCTKTGAHIFIEQYGEYCWGDAFEVTADDETGASIAYFRIVSRSFVPHLYALHYTVLGIDNWLDKDSPISTLIATSFINHGYEGKPI